MSVRCAVCGSKRVVSETKKEGYNVKKGLFGTLLFGSVGALAGAIGNENSYYHCSDCGQVMNRCMYDWESSSIDEYLSDPKKYYSFLKKAKEKYKNIEWENNIEVKKDEIEIMSKNEMADWIIRELEKKVFINADLFLRLAFYELCDFCRSKGYPDMISQINKLFEDSLSQLTKKYKIITEYIDCEEFYRLPMSSDETNEFLLKHKLVRTNLKRYISMLQENVEYKKVYTNEECHTIIETIFGEEIDFSVPYAYEAFMNQLIRQSKQILAKDEQIILFMQKKDMKNEADRKKEENMEYIKKCILHFLDANPGFHSVLSIMNQNNELFRWFPQKINSICLALVREGLLEQESEDSFKYRIK